MGKEYEETMMQEGKFKNDDLVPCPWQYQITHDSGLNFTKGERVFLKSNPEVPLYVYHRKKDKVLCRYENCTGIHHAIFPPQCILQYKYASLVRYGDKFDVCLN